MTVTATTAAADDDDDDADAAAAAIPGVEYNWGSMSWPAVVGGVVHTSRFVWDADQSVMSEGRVCAGSEL